MRLVIILLLLAGPALPQIPEGSVKVVGQRLSVHHAVQDSPYQATAVTEVKQSLADGNEILRKTVSRIARDSRGRVRLEQVEPELNRLILVSDPEASTGFSYAPGTGRAQTYVQKKLTAKPNDIQGVSLGKSVIHGLAVEGTRRITVIPAGQIGNVKPIEVVDETWYAPSLQIIVKSLHSDPRSGTVTYRLIGIELREPDPKLFELPTSAEVQR